MWTGVGSGLYYTLTLWGASEHSKKKHEYLLKLMEVPALIFTECAVIYNGKDHRNIYQVVLTVPLEDKLGPAFQHLEQFKGHTQARTGPEYENHLIYCTESACIKWVFPHAVINLMN